MATLASLKPSISELSGEEVFDLIIASRERRRKLFIDPRQVKKEAMMDATLEDMNLEELQALLELTTSQLGES